MMTDKTIPRADGVQRDPSAPKGRQANELDVAAIRIVLGDLPVRRDLLIEALHLVQDHFGFLGSAQMAALAEIFGLAQVEVFEVASFYHHFDIVPDGAAPPAPVTLRVCNGVSCQLAGADAVIDKLRAQVDPAQVRVKPVPCIGACDRAPAVNVGQRTVFHAAPETVIAAAGSPDLPDIPEYEGFEAYRSAGGYATLAKVLSGQITADQAVETMSGAGLRGLGGAGFPAGRKWSILRAQPAPRLMTINGDEGEPGTFKDRWWLERYPHRMIEGALIAAHVTGCARIYCYIRDEYPAVREILRREFEHVTRAGLAEHAPFELRRGAGAYICGEESAMIESIEGKRGIPRLRPPYIAERGLFGRPTLNHNVETLLWVPTILRGGARAFADQGIGEGHDGLRSFSVSGRVREPGVKTVSAGIRLIDLINDHCGGMAEGHELKAFFPGGASGGIFPASMAHLPMNFGTFEEFGGFIGSHAVVILSQQDSIHAAALNTVRFFAKESCGQCTPCRVGTAKLADMIDRPGFDHDMAEDLMCVMRDSSICGLGQAASNCVAHLVEHFEEELK